MRAGLAAVVAVLLVTLSCGDEEAPAVDITGTWWAVQLDDEPIEIGRNTAEIPWFKIDASIIGGSLGCNQGGGEYDLRGSRLRVSDFVSESMLCGSPDGSEVMVPTETILAWMLTAGTDVARDQGTMTWTGAGGHTITFEAPSSEPPSPTTEAPHSFGQLTCAPGVVVESRHPAHDITPEQLASEVAPTTARVEPGDSLQWWDYDAAGNVTVGVFLGGVPNADYQVVTCSN